MMHEQSILFTKGVLNFWGILVKNVSHKVLHPLLKLYFWRYLCFIVNHVSYYYSQNIIHLFHKLSRTEMTNELLCNTRSPMCEIVQFSLPIL